MKRLNDERLQAVIDDLRRQLDNAQAAQRAAEDRAAEASQTSAVMFRDSRRLWGALSRCYESLEVTLRHHRDALAERPHAADESQAEAEVAIRQARMVATDLVRYATRRDRRQTGEAIYKTFFPSGTQDWASMRGDSRERWYQLGELMLTAMQEEIAPSAAPAIKP